jgi:hypothetical protein
VRIGGVGRCPFLAVLQSEAPFAFTGRTGRIGLSRAERPVSPQSAPTGWGASRRPAPWRRADHVVRVVRPGRSRQVGPDSRGPGDWSGLPVRPRRPASEGPGDDSNPSMTGMSWRSLMSRLRSSVTDESADSEEPCSRLRPENATQALCASQSRSETAINRPLRLFAATAGEFRAPAVHRCCRQRWSRPAPGTGSGLPLLTSQSCSPSPGMQSGRSTTSRTSEPPKQVICTARVVLRLWPHPLRRAGFRPASQSRVCRRRGTLSGMGLHRSRSRAPLPPAHAVRLPAKQVRLEPWRPWPNARSLAVGTAQSPGRSHERDLGGGEGREDRWYANSVDSVDPIRAAVLELEAAALGEVLRGSR